MLTMPALPLVAFVHLIALSPAAAPTDGLPKLLHAQAAAHNALYREVSAHSPQNFVFAPWALQTAAGMLYAGAHGKTADELRKALLLEPDARAHAAAQAQLTAALALDERSPVVLKQATRLWIDNGFNLIPDYVSAMQKQYGADAAYAALSSHPAQAVTDINQWVATQTANLIPKLLTPEVVTQDTRLVQTAALYFKAPWTQAFVTDPNKRPFHGAHGAQEVEMMRRNAHDTSAWCHFNNNELEAVEIPYKGGTHALLLVVPKGDMKPFEARMDVSLLTSDQPGWDCSGLLLTLPPFHIETPLDVRSTLESLGVRTLFTPAADLAGISKKPLHVSAIVEKAVISVDKNGTEAAAATSTSMAIRSASIRTPPEMVVDRPFVFFIRDTKHHVVLFSGRVTDLPEK